MVLFTQHLDQHSRENMTKVYTLKVKLSGFQPASDAWVAKFEMLDSATLYDLHDAIQRYVEFDDDHLHEFYTGRSWSSRKSISSSDFSFDAENKFQGDGESAKLSEIFPLPKDHKLYYLFDFGDSWQFLIGKLRKEKDPEPGVEYPLLIEESGIKPKQYGDAEDSDYSDEDDND